MTAFSRGWFSTLYPQPWPSLLHSSCLNTLAELSSFSPPEFSECLTIVVERTVNCLPLPFLLPPSLFPDIHIPFKDLLLIILRPKVSGSPFSQSISNQDTSIRNILNFTPSSPLTPPTLTTSETS